MVGSESGELPLVVICTDGSCEPNPGEAGWGAVFYFPDRQVPLEDYGYIGYATSPQAELVAAVEALTLLDEPHQVELRSDSEWLVKCATGHYQRRKHLGLWQQIDQLDEQHTIRWRWIPGHTGNPCNERAHQLAELGRLSGGKGS